MTKDYAEDPRWQAARAEWIDDRRDGETATQRMLRSVVGAVRMCEVELEYEQTD